MQITRRIAVDIGNSGLKAVELPFDPQASLPEPLRINWQCDSSAPRSSSATTQSTFLPSDHRWTEMLAAILERSDPCQWWISSVNRPATAVLVEHLDRIANCQIELLDYHRIGLKIEVDHPEQVGIDRLLAAWAACDATASRPLIVIQAGSAVTVDLVEKLDGFNDSQSTSQAVGATKCGAFTERFCGGAIVPGVPMMLRLLGRAADLLPVVEASELGDLPPLPGKNTEGAMLAGASSSLVGGVRHLVQRYRQRYGADVPIVISGGDGPLLAPHLAQPLHVVPHLVLEGLRILAADYRR
jgi:pantothenate kinase type III